MVIAMPVSKPSWLVTNGKSKLVEQLLNELMLTVLLLAPTVKFGSVLVEPTTPKLTVVVKAVAFAATPFAVVEMNTGI